jgi:hypothetical protein
MTILMLIGLIFPRLIALLVWIFSRTDLIANDLIGVLGLIFFPYTFLAHIASQVLVLESNIALVLTILGLLVDISHIRLLKR